MLNYVCLDDPFIWKLIIYLFYYPSVDGFPLVTKKIAIAGTKCNRVKESMKDAI